MLDRGSPLRDERLGTMPRISLDTAHGLEHQHRYLGLGLVPRQRYTRDRRSHARTRDVPGTSMVQRMRDYIILALRAVAISRLEVAEAVEDFVDGFFEDVLH
jgi:hypothetical protein